MFLLYFLSASIFSKIVLPVAIDFNGKNLYCRTFAVKCFIALFINITAFFEIIISYLKTKINYISA